MVGGSGIPWVEGVLSLLLLAVAKSLAVQVGFARTPTVYPNAFLRRYRIP